MSRLLTAFYETDWAIVPDRLPMMLAVLHRWEAGIKLSEAEISAAIGDGQRAAAERRAQQAPKGIGILPILGVLAQRWAGDVSTPGTSADATRRAFASMVNDPSVGAIVLDIHSPGGSVFGIQELAAEIYAARGVKKVVAVANSVCASAAYWIATAAEEFIATPGGEVGSIGVLTAHEDHSAELEAKGVKVELLAAGKYKTEGNPFGPLSDETRAHVQARLDTRYAEFTGNVAKFRGVKPAEVREGFGQGRMVDAADAKALGMIDRIDTFDATINRLLSSARAQTPKTPRANQFDRDFALLKSEHDKD